MSTTALTAPTQSTVNMGEIAVLAGEQVARAILGSCLGVTVYDPQRRLGALAHIVLPTAEGRTGSPGKFVETAIPWMVDALRAKGADTSKMICKLTGGANMFAANGPFQIGQQNIAVARLELGKAGIRVVAEHLEGTQGRRVTFESNSGRVLVEVAGQPAASL